VGLPFLPTIFDLYFDLLQLSAPSKRETAPDRMPHRACEPVGDLMRRINSLIIGISTGQA